MPIFRYEAMSPSGDEEVDFVEASDKQSALQSLKDRKLFITRLVESSDGPAQSDSGARQGSSRGGLLSGGLSAAVAARARLEATLSELNPAGGILDTGDDTGRHASKVKKKK